MGKSTNDMAIVTIAISAAGCDARGWILWQDRSRAIDRNLGQLGYPRNHALVIIIGCELFFVSFFFFFCITVFLSFVMYYLFVYIYIFFFFGFIRLYIYIYIFMCLSIYIFISLFLPFFHLFIYLFTSSFIFNIFVYLCIVYLCHYICIYVSAYAYSFWALFLARPGLGFHGVTLPSISCPDVLHVTLTAESEKLGGEKVRQGSPLDPLGGIT